MVNLIKQRFSEDRLGLAWVRANKWEWDEEVLGPKPENYDNLPNYNSGDKSKRDYIAPAMRQIENELSRMVTSRYWWKYELGRTEEEWLKWYLEERTEW